MILNPELRRNLWLELSVQKLLVTPLVIGAIVYLCYLTEKHSADDAAYTIALFFLFLWGTKSASESIPNELHNHTWDYQRLSIMTPWTLSWGKLFGTTAYAWYGAIIALTFHTIISLQTEVPYLVIGKLITLMLGGLLAHSAALLSSMNGLQCEKTTKVNTLAYLMFGLFVAYWPTHHALGSISTYNVPEYSFYGFSISYFSFYFGSLCLFLFWSLMGIYRSMRSALQYPSLPWAWFAFTLCCLFYIPAIFQIDLKNSQIPDTSLNANLIPDLLVSLPRYIAFSVASLLTYLALFSEKINIITYKKLFYKAQKATHLPRWIVSFIVVISVGIWVGLLSPLSLQEGVNQNKIIFYPAVFSGSCILFLIRDTLMIHYFKFSESAAHRSATTALFYLAVLYILIPGLLLSLHAQNEFLTFFLPSSANYWALSLLAPALESLFMAWMVRKKWMAQSI